VEQFYRLFISRQGLGKAKGYHGLDGTIQVLEERKNIELEIFDLLDMNKWRIDNAEYNMDQCQKKIRAILESIV